MANYQLLFKQSVAADLRYLPKRDVARILARIEALRENPRPPGSEKLSGQERYRLRQANYRILYEVKEVEIMVVVVRIGHRREFCRNS